MSEAQRDSKKDERVNPSGAETPPECEGGGVGQRKGEEKRREARWGDAG